MRCWLLPDSRPDLRTLTLDLGAWEGPLDLLLALARLQKVNLREISILLLVHQYSDYLQRAGVIALDRAADYLVMAAWLAYLKSLLLLPRADPETPDPDALALRLQQRLRRLDAMRDAGAQLIARDRIDRDIFRRSAPEGLATDRKTIWQASLYNVIGAYGRVNARTAPTLHQVTPRPVMTLEAAINRITAMLGEIDNWTAIAAFLPRAGDAGGANAEYRRSALASTVVATLEMARRGLIDIRQDSAFGPLLVKAA